MNDCISVSQELQISAVLHISNYYCTVQRMHKKHDDMIFEV